MISALTDQHDIDKAMAAGATDYVTKPFKGLELGARLRAASFLANTLQQKAKDNLEFHALQLKLSRLDKPNLETAVLIEPNPGVVTNLELENGLLKLQDAIDGLEIMAFAIANIQEIYETLTILDFQKFLSSVAGKILSAVDTSASNIAYFGNGTFAVVAQRSMSARTIIEAGILSALKSEIHLSSGTKVQPVFAFAKAKHPDCWSAQRAYAGLLDAIKDAQLKCVN
jgi:CheY-like chemotaxis protein